MSTDEQRLLAEFAADHSEAAFQELVGRYVNLVYSTALRLAGGNAPLAQDITQTVFLSLARKAHTLSIKVMLGGWLHQHTYFVATRAVRSEQRRQTREREALEMNTLMDDSGAHWRQLAPVLDEAITQLGIEDRTAILLRFFEQRDFRAVGEALGSTQDAARVRVNRALEKLQGILRERGVALSATALGTLLTAEAVTAAPAGLALGISSAAFASVATAAGSGAALTFLKLMATTKLKLGLAALLFGGVATTVVLQHQSKILVQDENQALREQIAQLHADNEELSNRISRATALPAFHVPVPAPPIAQNHPVAPPPHRNLYELMTNRTSMIRLTAAQADAYLKENGRSAVSLLSAFRTSDNPALLQEALQRFPNDPQVNFEAAVSRDTLPADRRQYLDVLKQSSPDNALAYYLSAADHFKAGRTDQAVQDMVAAAGKTQFQDYSAERLQTDEEAYRAAGYPVADAKLLATKQLAYPQLVQVKELSTSMLDLAKTYQQSGDVASAQAALQLAADAARRFNDSGPNEPLIGRMLGLTTELAALRAMDPNSSYNGNGQTASDHHTVQDRINQLTQQRGGLLELRKQTDPIWPAMMEQDWISYQNRAATFGEEAAMRWIVSKFGTNP
jgi:RNA polymerase sigma factor (sigma-70 family)